MSITTKDLVMNSNTKQTIEIKIDHGSITIGEESISITQTGDELFLKHSEMDILVERYREYKEQKSVDKSVQDYLHTERVDKLIATSKRTNPDASGNISYLWD